LVGDGSIQRALQQSLEAMKLPDANYEDYLQAGYCLTALERHDEAAKLIRQATDIFVHSYRPGLYSVQDDSWTPVLPHFLIIGVKKGGTTSLHHHLLRHPRVLPSVLKEMDYFNVPERGWGWYAAHFPRRPTWERRFITGEATVDNFAAPGVPERVKQHLPGVKILAVLRDPVERALSHYYHDRRFGNENRSLEEAIERELHLLERPTHSFEENVREYLKSRRQYVYLGLYARHLERWFRVLPQKDIMVVISEELHASPEREMRGIFRHLGLKHITTGEYARMLPGTYDEQPKDRVRVRLSEFYAKYNIRLFELLGRRLNWQGALDTKA
jgi:hypothetical protein